MNFLEVVGLIALLLLCIFIITRGLEQLAVIFVHTIRRVQSVSAFYLDLMDTISRHTWAKKHSPRILNATRQVRRKIARRVAMNAV